MHSYLHVVVNHSGHCVTREFAEFPTNCPHCQQHIQPARLAARSTDPMDVAVDFAFQCPRPDCRRVFVASYHLAAIGEYALDPVGADQWEAALLALHS